MECLSSIGLGSDDMTNYLDTCDQEKAKRISYLLQKYEKAIKPKKGSQSTAVIKTIPNIEMRLITIILKVCARVPDEVSLNFSGDYILMEYNDYISMILDLNQKYADSDIMQSKITFCLFLGITTELYNNLLNNGKEEVRQAMQMVDSCLIDETLSSMEKRKIDTKAGTFRLQVKDVGHSLTTKESEDANNANYAAALQKNQISSLIDFVKNRTLVNKPIADLDNKKDNK